MMLRIFLFLLFFSFTQNIISQFYIKGRVTDSETQQPLKGASVYINNTTKGTVTDDSGDFQLGPFQPGQYEVVTSYVGYYPLLYPAEIKTSGLRISFKLDKKEATLREVLVLSSNVRKQYLDIFKKNLLGYSIAADRCKIKNIEEVQFTTGNSIDEIQAYTEKELVIENPELGYTIYFELIEFYYKKSNAVTYFLGYTRFVDWTKDEQTKMKWQHKRKQAYEGSTVHFFRSLLKKELTKENFTAYQLAPLGKPRIDTVSKKGTVNLNAGVQAATRAIEDSMVRLYSDSVYRIYELRIKDGWRIDYAKNTNLKKEIIRKTFILGQPTTGISSALRVREEPVLISERGIMLTPIRLFYTGMWGYEKLANMLPEDYDVE